MEISIDEKTLLYRLISGHLPLKYYKVKFNLQEDPDDILCEDCTGYEPETIEHLLFECQRFANIRMMNRTMDDEDFTISNCLTNKRKLTLKILKTKFKT